MFIPAKLTPQMALKLTPLMASNEPPDCIKRLKGVSVKLLLSEYPELKRRYWGGHLWGMGYGT